MAQKRLRDIFKTVALPMLAAAVVVGGPVAYNQATQQDMRVTVHNTESRLMRKGEGFGFTKTVYVTDKGELSNTLSPLNLKFNRAAIAQQLETGQTYDVTTVGVSIPALRIYPNIIKVTPVSTPPKAGR